MPSTQSLLFPDPRPLVDRLGPAFFRSLPCEPGVYLMRSEAGSVLYVGKARNLRLRLRAYRVANPDRLPRRHLHLLREVASIEIRRCGSEADALAEESLLLRGLRPRFNRAGVWPGIPRRILWQPVPGGLEMQVGRTPEPTWESTDAIAAAPHVGGALVRVVWLALNPGRRLTELPSGWLAGPLREGVLRRCGARTSSGAAEACDVLRRLGTVPPMDLAGWITACRTGAPPPTPLEQALLEADLDQITRRFNPIAARHGPGVEAGVAGGPPV